MNALEQVKSATTTDASLSSAKVAEDPAELEDDAVHLNSIHKLRYEALLAPTFSIFQHLRALTLDAPVQTSHEAWFQSTFEQVSFLSLQNTPLYHLLGQLDTRLASFYILKLLFYVGSGNGMFVVNQLIRWPRIQFGLDET